MKKFQRALAICLTMAMILTLGVGCSSGGSGSSTPAPSSTAPSSEAAPASESAAPSEGSGALDPITEPIKYDFPTFNMGSAWYSYAPAFADLMLAELPAGSQINILPNSGAIGNPLMIGQGDMMMAFGNNQSAYWAYNGQFVFDEAYTDIRGLVGNLDTYFYAAVMRDASGYTDLAEVAEKQLPIRVSTVPIGGMGEVVTRLVLEYYGITYEDIIAWGGKVEHNDFNTIVDNFKDGNTDFFLQSITQGHAALTELCISTPVHFLQFPDEMFESYCAEYGFVLNTLPAGSFSGQDTEVVCLGNTTNLIANAAMPDNVAYAITKAIVENPDTLHAAHTALARFSPETAADQSGLGVPLHPGAEAYYREAGLLD